MTMMIKILILRLSLLTAVVLMPPTFAFAADAPKAADWSKRFVASASKGEGQFPLIILAVKSLGGSGNPVVLDMNQAELAKNTYFNTADVKNLEWDFRLNSKDDSELRDLGFLQKVSAADTLLIEMGEGKWGVRFKGKIEADNIDAEFKMNPKADAGDAAAVLLKLFGYDGVILDVVENYVLVGSTSKILSQPNLQAMALADSSEKISMKKVARDGSGLLSLVDISGGYAVFDITRLGKGMSKLSTGTKVIIEKRSKS